MHSGNKSIAPKRVVVGIAALTALVGVCTPAIAEAADAPHAAGPSFGINSDGWTVRVTNHDEGADAHYVQTALDSITNAPAEIGKSGASNTVKGAAGLFGPADADITYAVGDGTIRLFLRSDLDGTTHHHCDVTGNAKCIIDPTPKDTPLEVHISSHTGIHWANPIGESAGGGSPVGWLTNIRNHTDLTLEPDTTASHGWTSAHSISTGIGPGESTEKMNYDFSGLFLEDEQRPRDMHLEYAVKDNPGSRFIADLSTDTVGRTHHTCTAPAGYHCNITPPNSDPNAHKAQPVLTVSPN